jgi:VWFA-related protein
MQFTDGVFLIAVLAALQFPAAAQEAPAQTQPPAQAPGPASTSAPASVPAPDPRKVVLDVVVAPKSGPAVGGLAQTDFTVLDNGAPQTLASFRALNGRDETVETLIIIDGLNTTQEHVSYAREELGKFLKSEGGVLAHPMALALLTEKGLQGLGPLSSDGNVLVAQLEKADVQLRALTRSTGFYGAEQRNEISVRTIGGLAHNEIGRPGRKMVIVLSPGWALLSGPGVQLDNKVEQSILNTIVQLNTDLRLARITLYSVDPLGTADAGEHSVYYKNFLKGVTKLSDVHVGDLGLQVLAEQSGGLALTESNDVAGEIRRCLADAANYYQVSYDAPAAAPNAKAKPGEPEFHKIEVKLATNGDTARTRMGYYISTAQ